MRESAPIDQAQPSRRMTWSMTQDLGLSQDPPLASASEAIITSRITKSRAQAMGVEHQLVSLFLILRMKCSDTKCNIPNFYPYIIK